MSSDYKAFIALLQAGLWEKDVELRKFGTSDFEEIMRLAEEQSVVGLITAGMERATDKSVPKVELLQFIGQTLQIEEQNKAMNYFIGVVVDAMRKEKIHTTLIKGQGIAQCYERPLWRSSGDVDLMVDEDDYRAAKIFFAKIASSTEPEEYVAKHIGFSVGSWLVELHGHMYFGLSYRAYKVVLEVEEEILRLGGVRVWNNNGVDVYLPNPDNDIIILFTHFLGHFCFGGVGLKQMCDMCRLLWKYQEELDVRLLKSRLMEMGLMSEWKVFAALAVNWLGMPTAAMPFYDSSWCYKIRAFRAIDRILRAGGMEKKSEWVNEVRIVKRKTSFGKFIYRFREFLNLITIFPLDAHRFFLNYLIDKVRIRRARSNRKFVRL